MKAFNRWVRWGVRKFLPKFFNVVVIFGVVLQPVGTPGLFTSFVSTPTALAADEEATTVEEPAPADEPKEEVIVPQEETVSEEPAAEEVTEPTPTIEEPVVSDTEEEEAVDDTATDSTEKPSEEVAPSEEAPTVVEEVTETPSDISVVEESVVPAVEGVSTETSSEETPLISQETEEIVLVSEELAPVSEKICMSASATQSAEGDWEVSGDVATTNEKVTLGVRYVFPLDKEVALTFTCLPSDTSKLSTLKIERIKASDIDLPEGTVVAGEYAYDITTDMENGTFSYDLSLPKTEGIDGTVSYIEKSADEVRGESLNKSDIKNVDEKDVDNNKDSVDVLDLDHFTVFFILSTTNAATGTGVYTSTTGPNITESAVGQVGLGTLILTVPSGFQFDTTSNSVTATVTPASCPGTNQLKLSGGSLTQTVTPTVSTITVTVATKSSGNSACKSTITWSGIKTRPTVATPLASGDIALSGTSTLGGAAFSTNTFTEVDPDTIAPTLLEVTPVATPTNDSTPNYTFSSSEAGTISYGGDCSSATVAAAAGNNTVTFNTLSDGVHANCTVKVTDAALNQSLTLNVSSFTVDTTAPIVTVNTQTTADTTPALSGTVNDATASISVTVDGTPYPATNNGATWTLADNTISPALTNGTYNVTVAATDAVGNVGSDATTDELTIASLPDLTVTKTNNVSDNGVLGSAFDWVLTITNSGVNTATFANNKVVLKDELPAGATYGTPNIVNGGGTTGTNDCSLSNSDVLTCKSNGTVTLPVGGTITVTIPVTPTATGSLVNPVSGGVCAVDSSTVVTESNEGNNDCANTVNITGATLTLVKEVINDNGGTKDVSDFDLFYDATQVTSGQTSTVAPGTYTLSETGDSEYTASAWVCTGTGTQNDDDITLDAGEDATCTLTNDDIGGEILIDVVTAPSGNAQSFDFTLTGGPSVLNQSFSMTESDSPVSSGSITPGNGYEAALMSLPTGWTLTDTDCDDSNSSIGNIKVEIGEIVTCTFTLSAPGSITILKEAYPQSSQVFDFKIENDSFTLVDDGSASNTATFSNLLPGTYKISEQLPNGPGNKWKLEDISCFGNSVIEDKNANDKKVTLELQAGEDITCTFSNYKSSTVVIKKETIPDGAIGSFPFTSDLLGLNGSISDGGELVALDVDEGQYQVTEDLVEGFDLTGISCLEQNGKGQTVDSVVDVANRTVTLNVDKSENVTCTFTNTARGTINLVKNTIGDDGSFDFTVGGDMADTTTIATVGNTGSQTYENILAGSYSIVETAQAGWDLTGTACVSSYGDTETADNISLDPGETITCTFTNTARGTITVKKVTTKTPSDEVFFFTADYRDAFQLVNGESVTDENLLPGTYSVTEADKGGWQIQGLSCVDNNVGTEQQQQSQSLFLTLGSTVFITLVPGADVVCTYTNHDDVDDSRWWLDGNGGGNGGGQVAGAFFNPFAANAAGGAGETNEGAGTEEGSIVEGAQTENTEGGEVLGEETANTETPSENPSWWWLWILVLLLLGYAGYRYKASQGSLGQ